FVLGACAAPDDDPCLEGQECEADEEEEFSASALVAADGGVRDAGRDAATSQTKEIKVTVVGQGGTVSISSWDTVCGTNVCRIRPGQVVTLNALPWFGYKFVSWTCNKTVGGQFVGSSTGTPVSFYFPDSTTCGARFAPW
ncbi:MAG TPA: hypothetical protein VFX59_17605, partial [Polyangiales bacterium]|nr:hypothetical protein [Polyangiales bacterium]